MTPSAHPTDARPPLAGDVFLPHRGAPRRDEVMVISATPERVTYRRIWPREGQTRTRAAAMEAGRFRWLHRPVTSAVRVPAPLKTFAALLAFVVPEGPPRDEPCVACGTAPSGLCGLHGIAFAAIRQRQQLRRLLGKEPPE